MNNLAPTLLQLGKQTSFMSSINKVNKISLFCSVSCLPGSCILPLSPLEKATTEQQHNPASQVDTGVIYGRSEHLEEKKRKLRLLASELVFIPTFLWRI